MLHPGLVREGQRRELEREPSGESTGVDRQVGERVPQQPATEHHGERLGLRSSVGRRPVSPDDGPRGGGDRGLPAEGCGSVPAEGAAEEREKRQEAGSTCCEAAGAPDHRGDVQVNLDDGASRSFKQQGQPNQGRCDLPKNLAHLQPKTPPHERHRMGRDYPIDARTPHQVPPEAPDDARGFSETGNGVGCHRVRAERSRRCTTTTTTKAPAIFSGINVIMSAALISFILGTLFFLVLYLCYVYMNRRYNRESRKHLFFKGTPVTCCVFSFEPTLALVPGQSSDSMKRKCRKMLEKVVRKEVRRVGMYELLNTGWSISCLSNDSWAMVQCCVEIARAAAALEPPWEDKGVRLKVSIGLATSEIVPKVNRTGEYEYRGWCIVAATPIADQVADGHLVLDESTWYAITGSDAGSLPVHGPHLRSLHDLDYSHIVARGVPQSLYVVNPDGNSLFNRFHNFKTKWMTSPTNVRRTVALAFSRVPANESVDLLMALLHAWDGIVPMRQSFTVDERYAAELFESLKQDFDAKIEDMGTTGDLVGTIKSFVRERENEFSGSIPLDDGVHTEPSSTTS